MISAVPGLVVSDTPVTHEASDPVYRSDVFQPAPRSARASLSAEEILARVEVAKLGEATSGGSVDIQDVIDAGELTEEKRKEIGKALVEKHMLESVDLENKLRESEIQNIDSILEDVEKQKKAAIQQVQDSLKESLKDVQDEEEREKLIMQHADQMEAVSAKFADQKESKLKSMRDRMKKERLKRKQSLYR